MPCCRPRHIRDARPLRKNRGRPRRAEDRQVHIKEKSGVALRFVRQVGQGVCRGRLDHRHNAHEAFGRDDAGEFLSGKCCASRFVVAPAAVVDRIVEPDCGVDDLRIGKFGAVFAGKRQQRLDMGKPMVVAARLAVEGRKLCFELPADQGFVCHHVLESR